MTRNKDGLLSVEQLGLVLDGAVRPNKRKPGDLKSYLAKLNRVARKVPEVLVKVTGSGKRAGQSLAHMTYITRNGKVEAENERGEKIVGLAEVKQVFDEWGFSTANASTRQRAQTVNIVLSMPEGTNPQAVLEAARGFAKDRFSGNHQYLMALHTDEPHPHVHLSVKAQGFDLTWLRRSKADLQEWREAFAQKLREQGVEAEATPRRARGVVRKSAKQAMHHLGKTPKRSMVIKAKVEEVIRASGTETAQGPWEHAIRKGRNETRRVYARTADALRGMAESGAHAMGDRLEHFLNSMPNVDLERANLARRLAEVASRSSDRTR